MTATRVLLLIGVLTSTLAAAQIPLPAPLSDVLGADDFVVVEGLTFDLFTYSATGEMPPPDMVNVLPIQDASGNWGIRFQGGFLDTVGTAGGSDALITYRVSAPTITQAHLAGNPDLLAGNGLAQLTETFIPQVDNDSISIFDNGTVEQLTDSIAFAGGLSQINVQKNIGLLGEAANSAGSAISFVDQTFSVPEPSSLTSILLGVMGLMLTRRRPKK